jgi:hypothetical protein
MKGHKIVDNFGRGLGWIVRVFGRANHAGHLLKNEVTFIDRAKRPDL